MNQKDLVILILVIALVASVGVTIYLAQRGPIVVGGQAQKELCGIIPSYTGGPASSDEFPPSVAQDICYMVFANEQEDSTICKKIKSLELQGMCFSILAIKTGDESLCELASVEARDRCYGDFASQVGGESGICEKINNPNQQDQCYSNLASKTQDAGFCRKIDNVDMRDNCILNMSFLYTDPSFCDKIPKSDIKRDCKARFNQ